MQRKELRRAARGINSCLPAAVTSLDLPLDSSRAASPSNELELISDRVLHPRPKTAYLSHFLARFQEDTLPVKSTVSLPQNKGELVDLDRMWTHVKAFKAELSTENPGQKASALTLSPSIEHSRVSEIWHQSGF